jgi:hypothetical protein
MNFRDAEKARYQAIKDRLFSPAACRSGMYKRSPRVFCLAEGHSIENLFEGVREEALAYFVTRGIPWHEGYEDDTGHRRAWPSNHLCCSQTACVNSLWPMTREGDLLARVFRRFLPELDEPLPFVADGSLPDGAIPWLAFEWIGTRNYLGEKGWGVRGANATSADFAFRFRRRDGRIQLVLGEWKYTEYYGRTPSAREAINPTRWVTYQSLYELWRTGRSELPPYETFFVEPFYQLMRQTLLAQAMEQGGGEMEAEVVSIVHIAPAANREFHDNMHAAPALRAHGETVCRAWTRLAPPDRFLSISSEDLYAAIGEETPDGLRPWADYLRLRYGWWSAQ